MSRTRSDGRGREKRGGRRLAVLGCGKMGTILLQAFLQHGLFSKPEVAGTVQHAARTKDVAAQLGVKIGTDNRAAVAGAEIVLVCVKPQAVAQLLEEISADLAPGTLLISIAASVPIAFIQQRLPSGISVVRAMPNTPATVG